jgi:hypothetical protein
MRGRFRGLDDAGRTLREPIPLPALGDRLDETRDQQTPTLGRKEAARHANAAVELLKKDPNDTAAREKLARLFAEQLEKADLGIEQIGLLLDMPEQPDTKRAEWLSLLAAWHIKYKHDLESGRRFLQKLTAEFPDTPYAFAARVRLERMSREQRSKDSESATELSARRKESAHTKPQPGRIG